MSDPGRPAVLSLRKVEQAFVGAVADALPPAEHDRPIGRIADDEAGAPKGLGVYPNTVRINRKNALRATYPVVERLLGENLFNRAAETFAGSHPSGSDNLDDYGVEFPDFLEGFAPAASLAYLPDVARLELLVDRLMVAEDDRHVRSVATPLAAYDVRLDHTLKLTARRRLLKSDFPIHRIWQVNQPGFEVEGAIDLSEGGALLLVRRNDFAIEIVSLEHAEFAFLSALDAGLSLGAAVASARAVEPRFDAAQSLGRRFGDGTVAVPFSLVAQMPWRWTPAGALPE
jgi:hypothetical protein